MNKCLRWSKRDEWNVRIINQPFLAALQSVTEQTCSLGRLIVEARQPRYRRRGGKRIPFNKQCSGEPRCRESETKWNLTAISTGLLGRGVGTKLMPALFSLGTFAARANKQTRERKGRGGRDRGEIFRRWNGKWSVTAALEIQIRGPSWEGEANFCANTVQHRLNAAQPAVHANAESTKHFPPFERDFPSNGGGEGEPLPPETISASCCSPELS